MTREEAKKELKPIKEMEADIRSVELEIERLMTIATKMTPNYEGAKVLGDHKNKIEEAAIQLDEYRSKLSHLVVKELEYKNKCLDKVTLIQPGSLRKILMYYYFMDMTLEKTAELIGRSYQWTYTMFIEAIDKYCEISDKIAVT
jgi:hypothetical protein